MTGPQLFPESRKTLRRLRAAFVRGHTVSAARYPFRRVAENAFRSIGVRHRASVCASTRPLATGGSDASDTEVAHLRRTTTADVEEQRAADRLLAVEVDGSWRFPSMQFYGLGLLPGMEDLFVNLRGLRSLDYPRHPARQGRSVRGSEHDRGHAGG